MVTVQHVAYGGWPNCYSVSDGELEAIATTDVGPRIIRCGLVGGINTFVESAADSGRTGGSEYRLYGGHRLWYAPETRAVTYYPDNQPVHCEKIANGIVLRQEPEAGTGIEKSIQLVLDGAAHAFTLTHRIANRGAHARMLGPWAITMMNTGGVAVLPNYREVEGEGMLPNRTVSLWSYTDMSDPRVTWGSRFTLVRQDPNRAPAFKIGQSVPQGWMAYLNRGVLFVKTYGFERGAPYPDGGVNCEVYTADSCLELETLSPMIELAPGAAVTHIERWTVYSVSGLITDEASVWPQLGTHIQKALTFVKKDGV